MLSCDTDYSVKMAHCVFNFSVFGVSEAAGVWGAGACAMTQEIRAGLPRPALPLFVLAHVLSVWHSSQ